MRAFVAFAVLAAVASPAAAQCVSIGDGAGNAAIHCWDGRIGHLQAQPGGAVAGMLGGQVFTGPAEQVVPPALGSPQPLTGYVNPDIAVRTAPLPPPSLKAPSPEPAPPLRPHPDPESTGTQRQPGQP